MGRREERGDYEGQHERAISVASDVCDRAGLILTILVVTQVCCSRAKTDTHTQRQAHQYRNPGLMPYCNFVRYSHERKSG